MIKDISLIVAKVTDWVLTKMRICESSVFEIWKTVQVEKFLEVADLVGSHVQVD